MRLIEGGCDPMLVLRRLIAHSAEDVGMTDPQSWRLPRSRRSRIWAIPKGSFLSPRRSSTCARQKRATALSARSTRQRQTQEIHGTTIFRRYLRDNSYGSKEQKTESGKYLYPHSFGGWVEQQYPPASLKDKKHYIPSDHGFEAEVKKTRERKGMKKD